MTGSQICYDDDYGAMLIEASESNINFQFINRTGDVIDTYNIDPTVGSTSVDIVASNSTAVSPDDYTCAKTVIFTPAKLTKKVSCPIVDDGVAEPTEKFYVILDNPVGATLGEPWVAPVNVIDNDGDGSATLTIHVPVADGKTQIRLIPKHGNDPIVWRVSGYDNHCEILQDEQGTGKILIKPLDGPIECELWFDD